MTTETQSPRPGLPETWDALAAMRPLRPIADRDDMDTAAEFMDRLALLDESAMTADQSAYLDALSTLVDAYETRHHPLGEDDPSAIDLLNYLLEQNAMTPADLGRLLGDKSGGLGGRILRGERELSKNHIRILAARFHVNPGMLLADGGKTATARRHRVAIEPTWHAMKQSDLDCIMKELPFDLPSLRENYITVESVELCCKTGLVFINLIQRDPSPPPLPEIRLREANQRIGDLIRGYCFGLKWGRTA